MANINNPARLTKAQLLERIAKLERELSVYETQACIAERPSRRAPLAPVVTETTVMLHGVPHRKVRAWEHGRIVTTYKPIGSDRVAAH